MRWHQKYVSLMHTLKMAAVFHALPYSSLPVPGTMFTRPQHKNYPFNSPEIALGALLYFCLKPTCIAGTNKSTVFLICISKDGG